MIHDILPVNNYQGNNISKTFDFDFYIDNESQLAVYLYDKNNSSQKLELNVDYSINEIKNRNGSYITYPLEKSSHTILKDDENISLELTLPKSQETQYNNSSLLNLEALEYSLDYLTRLVQILARKLSLCVKVQEISKYTPDEMIDNIYKAQSDAQNSAQKVQSLLNEIAKNSDEIKNNLDEFYNTYQNAFDELKNEAKIQLENIISSGFYMLNEDIYYTDSSNKESKKYIPKLNDPFSLFDSKYCPYLLHNKLWLLSNNTYYSKELYTAAYEALLAEQNPDMENGDTLLLSNGKSYTKRGLSVKSSDEEFCDYDFVLNKENETFKLPIRNNEEYTAHYNSESRLNIINYKRNNQFNCPSNGVVVGVGNTLATSSTTILVNSLWAAHIGLSTTTNARVEGTFSVPVKKGDMVYVDDVVREAYFYPNIGNGFLYYYVGSII